MSTRKPLTFEERRNLRRLAEDAISAADRHYAPFVDAVAHPLNILSLLDMVDTADRQSYLVRIDVILPNGMPDSQYLTHDECRRIVAENGDLKRTLLNLQRAIASIPEIKG